MEIYAPPSLLPYSIFTDDSGYPIHSFLVDYRDPENRHQITTLAKRCERKYAFEECGTICISKPEKYREFGETLIKDPSEGSPTQILQESTRIDDPNDLAKAQACDEELNQMARIAGSRQQRITRSVTTKTQHKKFISLDKFGWIYCASIAPAGQDEEDAWIDSFRDNNYDHSSYIHRPLEFLHALGAMVVEKLGPQMSNVKTQSNLADQSSVEYISKGQVLFHGPVIYVENPYEVVANAIGTRDFYLPFLVKSVEYKDQQEYRFVILTDDEPVEIDEILDVSPAMKGSTRKHTRSHFTQPELQDKSTSPLDNNEPDSPAAAYSSARHESIIESSIYDNLARQVSESILDQSSAISPKPILDSTLNSDDVVKAITTINALKALRDRVSGLLGDRPRVEVAAAAYHAEPFLLGLCEKLENPIESIAIEDQNFIVASINFPQSQRIVAKLIFGPSGAISLSTKKPQEQSFSVYPDIRLTNAQDITGVLEKMGIPRRSPVQ